jgi:uncharacterized membrane protein
MSWYHTAVLLHVLSALFWLGGMFFLALVGAPVLRRVEPPALRATLFRDLGRRFRRTGWIAIGFLLATGTWILHLRGLLRSDVLGDGAFWSSRYGLSLAVKMGAVAVIVSLAALHDFVLGPAAAREPPGTSRALQLRRRTVWIARANVLVGVVLVYAALRLARGG